MDKRLSGPAYLYDAPNAERGGLVTRQTLVKKDPHGMAQFMAGACCVGETPGDKPGSKVADRDGSAFRERL